jgi:hypothetical protein
MQKADLHSGHFYGYRENTRAWERTEDRPIKVELIEPLAGGRNRIRFPDGSESEVRSAQLIFNWSEEAVAKLLRHDERERGFREATFSDWRVSEAASVVFDTVLGKNAFHAQNDRGWLRDDQEQRICAAAEVTEDLAELSPVAERAEDELCLPLQTVELLAKRIAERTPDAIEAEVKRAIADLEERGYHRLFEHYKDSWNLALEWAGKEPVAVPAKELSPSEAFKELWDRLHGQGMRSGYWEERAWFADADQLRTIGPLLAQATSYAGRLAISDLGDGKFRVALELQHEPEALDPQQMANLAFSLSQPQALMLSRIREAGSEGFEFPSELGKDKTLESLIKEELVWESTVKGADREERHSRGRFRLTDAGWRALEHLKPRAT